MMRWKFQAMLHHEGTKDTKKHKRLLVLLLRFTRERM